MKPIPIKYNYLVERLTTDPFFIEWTFYPCSVHEENWTQLLDQHAELSPVFDEARSRLLLFSYGKERCHLICQAIHLFISMKNDIRLLAQKKLHPLRITEGSFQVARNYWSAIRNGLVSYEFEMPAQEIHFFKVIKPLFTAEAIFFSLQYHAQLFCQYTTPEEQMKFCMREQRRKLRFAREHFDFVKCFLKGCCDMDRDWFCRTSEKDSSSHDHLVAEWLGVQRYDHFIRQFIYTDRSLV